jgi:hypothetical protein
MFMALGVAIIIGIIVLGVLLVVALGGFGASASRRETALDPRIETLRYHVPAGQDPTVLVAALSKDGYVAAEELVAGEEYIGVACPAGRDRERAHVRAIIASTHRTTLEEGKNDFEPGRVVFEDEMPENRENTSNGGQP